MLWSYILAAQAITAADYYRMLILAIVSSTYILEQRLAQAAWLLSTVNNCNLLYSIRN